MKYTVSDRPPAWETVLLGFQHYLTMLGATVVIPIILVPAMGGSQKDLAQTINTIFFISGINTLVQTTLGDRLPIVQGGSFAYLTPTFGVIFSAQLQSIEDPELRFRTTMQTIQGAVIICGVVQVVMAMTGLLTLMLRFVSPLTIAPSPHSASLRLGAHTTSSGRSRPRRSPRRSRAAGAGDEVRAAGEQRGAGQRGVPRHGESPRRRRSPGTGAGPPGSSGEAAAGASGTSGRRA